MTLPASTWITRLPRAFSAFTRSVRLKVLVLFTCLAVIGIAPGVLGATPKISLDKPVWGHATRAIVNFTGESGANPGAAPVGKLAPATDGTLYGLTRSGGTHGFGTVFRLTITATGARQTTLLNFTGVSGPNPGAGGGGLVQGSDGNFYGITAAGGASNKGIIFRLVVTGDVAVETTLAEFTGVGGLVPGSNPTGELIQAGDGNFYGVTKAGGANDKGTVFQLAFPNGTATVTTPVEFTGIAGTRPGAAPLASLLQATDGSLYGTTSAGGAFNNGTIFKLTPVDNTATFTNLVEFTGVGGANPGAFSTGSLMQAADGSLYGTTEFGGTSHQAGTIFRLELSENGVTHVPVLLLRPEGSLSGPAHPVYNLVQARDGNFHVAFIDGGSNVYSFGIGSSYLTPVAEFYTVTDPSLLGARVGPLYLDADENLFGLSETGGSNDCGLVFEIFAPPLFLGLEGSVETRSGTFSPNGGSSPVIVSASSGTVTQNNSDGTWEWTHSITDGPSRTEVTITATAATGEAAAVKFIIELANRPPSVYGFMSEGEIKAGKELSITLLGEDYSAADRAAGFAWSVDFGDGSEIQYFPAGTRSPLELKHTYLSNGTYEVIANITDKDGATSPVYGSSTLTIYVAPPTIAVETPWQYPYLGTVATDHAGEPAEFVVSHTGGDLQLGAITIIGENATDFQVDTAGMKQTLTAGESTTFRVIFAPKVAGGLGERTATLQIASNDPKSNPYQLQIHGSATDGTPPAFTFVPSDVTVQTDSQWTVVTYPEAFATDNSGAGPTLTYSHPSGWLFPLGATKVTVTATDAAGNVSTATFMVRVGASHVSHGYLFSNGADAPGRGNTAQPLDTPPVDARLHRIGSPALDEDGNIAFFSHWTATFPGGAGGIFTRNRCVTFIGGPVPGIAGASFKTLSDPVISAGRIGFLSKLSGVTASEGGTAWVSPPEGPLLIAQTGTVAPNAAGIRPLGGAKFKAFKGIAVEGESVLLLAQLSGAAGSTKVNAGNDTGLWIKDASHPLTLALREGQTIEGRTIKALVSFTPGNGSPGQGRGWLTETASDGARALAYVAFIDKTQAIVSAGFGGSVEVLASADVAIKNIPGGTFASYGVPATNAAGVTAFLASLAVTPGGPVTRSNAPGIFIDRGDSVYECVARLGSPAGDTGGTFSVLKDPVLAADGSIAFTATIEGSGIHGAASATLWSKTSEGPLKLVARGGQPAGDLAGAIFKSFSSIAIVPGRGPIFSATLETGNGVTAATANGVWAVDYFGVPRLLFRTGYPVQLYTGKTLKSFTLLNAVAGSSGVTRSFNERGKVVWLAHFNNGTTEMIETDIP